MVALREQAIKIKMNPLDVEDPYPGQNEHILGFDADKLRRAANKSLRSNRLHRQYKQWATENDMTEDPATPRINLPSDADYGKRVKRAQTGMREHCLDVLAQAGTNILRFITGLHGLPVTRPIWLILPQVGAPSFVSHGSEKKEIRARCNTPVVTRWVEWAEPVPGPMTHQDALAKYLQETARDARTIGIDFNGASGANIELVRQVLGTHRVKDAGPLLRDLLTIKDAAAINAIRLCCYVVTTRQFEASRDAIAPGVPEWKVALASFAGTERAAELWGENGEQSPLAHGLHMTGSGSERTARCDAAGAARKMWEGDIVQICRCSTGFYGHLIGFDRPVKIGSDEPAPEMRKVIDLAREAQEAALGEGAPRRHGWRCPCRCHGSD
ncbi:M24 family metallopeptidase [Neorhizobium sp. SHOUNA12A]|nr:MULTISPECIES: aminopeptidase P family protein [unclassified Neorhizobium]MCJ9670382.1 M24 family metallopeptidase [Neorhizobium sp. SHOUNA12B]MCJ9746305.1 M24 family metallopeptidase [Neorhizobium sp. SHOUNA12A]